MSNKTDLYGNYFLLMPSGILFYHTEYTNTELNWRINVFRQFCYTKLSDRVADTCEARDRGENLRVSPSFVLRRKKMPKKNFSTFEEQVERLRNEKHIIISDKQYAEDVLKHIGYFPLMGGICVNHMS